MKFYCTKWWSTLGIVEFEGEVSQERYASTHRTHDYSKRQIFERIGGNAFYTLEEAQKDVEKKAHANLHSKEKALVKAKKLLDQAVQRKIKVVT